MLKNYNSFPLLEEYLSYLTVIKGHSLNTVTPYRTNVLMFFEFLCNRRKMGRAKYDLSMIDTDFTQSIKLNDMYAFISHCQMENNASAGTRARKIVSIRQFRKYLKNMAHAIDNNVAEDLEMPKIPKRIPKYLSFEESERRTGRSVQGMVKKCIVLANLGHKNISVHKLCHTAATLMSQDTKRLLRYPVANPKDEKHPYWAFSLERGYLF